MKKILSSLCFALLLAPLCFGDSKEDWETLKKNDPNLLQQRMQAAKLIAERAKQAKECGKIAAEFIDIANKANTPPPLRTALSDALATCDSEDTAKALMQNVGKGQPTERAWTVRTARGITSPDLDKAILQRALNDEDPVIREAAVEVLVEHKYLPAIPAFEAILKSAKDTDLLGPIVSGITRMLNGSAGWADWEGRLVEYAKSKSELVRRAALASLSIQKNVQHIDIFLTALDDPDWSTRALAVAFLEKCGAKQAVGAIIARFGKEEKGTRMHAEILAALGRLSGMNFGDKADEWATWWKNNESTFEFPKSSGKAKTEGRKQPKLDTGTSVAQFYGIEVDSKRVCFVIDISGSMKEPTRDATSPGTPRIDVAKRELVKIVEQLPPGSLFNIVTFNSDVESWLDHIGDLPGNLGGKTKPPKGPTTGDAKKDKEKPKDEAEKKRDADKQKQLDDALRAKAKEYVERQGANGGTNIYGAFEAAFDDPNVDTIFFLTDGNPSDGRELDPTIIRESVARWNAVRKIKINTIAIGTDFEYLKGVSQDSGGEHKFFE